MAIMKRTIAPTHPGEVPREDFLADYGMTAPLLAKALGVSRQTVNEFLREKRAVSPIMVLRLSRLFGNSPQFWLNAQNARNLWETEQEYKPALDRIQQLKTG